MPASIYSNSVYEQVKYNSLLDVRTLHSGREKGIKENKYMTTRNQVRERVKQILLDGFTAAAALWIGQMVLPEYEIFNRLIYKSTGVPGASPWLYILFPAAVVVVQAAADSIGMVRGRTLKEELIRIGAGSLVGVGFSWIILSAAEAVFSKRLLVVTVLTYVMAGLVPYVWYRLEQKGRISSAGVVQNVLAPAVLMSVYALLYSQGAARILPEGVNPFFARTLSLTLLGVIGILLLAAGQLVLWGGKLRMPKGKTEDSGVGAGRLLLLLVIAAPVVQYILANRDILSVEDMVIILGAVLLAGLVVGYGIPAVLGRVMSRQVTAAIGLSFLLTVINMASLSRIFAWYGKGNIWIQLVVLAAGYGLFWMFGKLDNNRDLALAAGVLFLFGSGVLQLPFNGAYTERGSDGGVEESLIGLDHPLITMVQEEIPERMPNIYFLVYESYVNVETMAAHGINNSEQMAYLLEQGFVHYPHTYTVAPFTIGSMRSMLNASSGLYGKEPRSAASGDGVVQNALRQLGYVTYGVFSSDYIFRGVGSSYDVYYPEVKTVEPYAYLLSAIAVGEFRFDLEEDLDFANISFDEFSQRKREVLGSADSERKFLYTHTPMPGHSQNSGTCLPDEIQRYEEHLRAANEEMKRDISLLLENDPGAIIIIAGDHGPSLTKNCTFTSKGGYELEEISRLDIQDRYGAFLAVRWPQGERYDGYEIEVMQKLFLTVFAYMYDDLSIMDFATEEDLSSRDRFISGANVIDGIIQGGIHDGEPLFTSD